MIDYERAKREGPKLKTILTRARNVPDPSKRWVATLNACKSAVATWDMWGAWPDGWATWQRALDDAYYNLLRHRIEYTLEDMPSHAFRLEEL